MEVQISQQENTQMTSLTLTETEQAMYDNAVGMTGENTVSLVQKKGDGENKGSPQWEVAGSKKKPNSKNSSKVLEQDISDGEIAPSPQLGLQQAGHKKMPNLTRMASPNTGQNRK